MQPNKKAAPVAKKAAPVAKQEEPQTAGDAPEEVKSDKVQVCAKKENYVKTRTAAGKPSLHCGDAVAEAFAGLDIKQKYTLTATLLAIKSVELEDKYGHLNVGMQGMSLANRTRGALNKDVKLKEPTGLLEKMNELVAPMHAEAKKVADAKAKVAAEKAAEAKKVADAKEKSDAETAKA